MSSLRHRLQADAGVTMAGPVDHWPDRFSEAVQPDVADVVFDPEAAPVRDELPERTAMLCVTPHRRDGQSYFKLTWYFADEDPDESRDGELLLQTRPPQTVGDALAARTWKTSYQAIAGWWKIHMRLAGWFEKLLLAAREGHHVRLIVWDRTDFQIPWEMYYDADRLLGAEVEVLRWTAIWDRTRFRRYTAPVGTCIGGVLAMETPDIKANTGEALAQMLQPYGSAPVADPIALLTALNDESLHIGLVLLRCHGADVDDREFVLGGETYGTYEIDYGMPLLEKSPAVVLLNACSSGNPVPPAPGAVLATQNFAELFLRRGAYGVIATLGQISLDYSHDFAHQILAAYDEDQRIGEILRRRRQRAAEKVSQKAPARKIADYEDFFQTFAYVYYGHPDATMRLTAVDQAGPS